MQDHILAKLLTTALNQARFFDIACGLPHVSIPKYLRAGPQVVLLYNEYTYLFSDRYIRSTGQTAAL